MIPFRSNTMKKKECWGGEEKQETERGDRDRKIHVNE